MAYQWKYAGTEKGNLIYLDLRMRKTKVITGKEIIYYDGIYPWHENKYKRKQKYN